MPDADRQAHWNAAYSGKSETAHSWFEAEPRLSLALIERYAPDKGAAIIDVGAGASRLADGLLERGYGDLTLLDLAATGLELTRARLGERADKVRFVVADIVGWMPTRPYDLWHDRAVFHFLTEDAAQEAYLAALRAGTRSGSTVIIATFAADGPERCSGLSVARYSPEALADRLGPEFAPLQATIETHVTPGGRDQRFTIAAFARA